MGESDITEITKAYHVNKRLISQSKRDLNGKQKWLASRSVSTPHTDKGVGVNQLRAWSCRADALA